VGASQGPGGRSGSSGDLLVEEVGEEGMCSQKCPDSQQPADSGPAHDKLPSFPHGKSVYLHLRPICWKLQNTCHIASWHRSGMFAWKSTDSYTPLSVVIFRRVVPHLTEAALN
jgi:hypothetical protein